MGGVVLAVGGGMRAEVKARVLDRLRRHEWCETSAGVSRCAACGGWQAHADGCAWVALMREVAAEPEEVAGRGPTIYSGTDGTSVMGPVTHEEAFAATKALP